MKRIATFAAALLLGAVLLANAQAGEEGMKKRVEASFDTASQWLISKQGDEGAWKAGGYPSTAYTALCVYALAGAPEELRKGYDAAIDKGIKFLLSKVDDDGSIAEADGTYRSYATSLSLMAMSTANKEKYREEIKKAQDYLTGKQVKEGVFKGGSGYGDKKHGKDGKLVDNPAADLSNSSFVAEALEKSGLPKDSEYWKNIIAFVAASQNNSETNTDPAALKAMAEKKIKNGNDGGIRYSPLESRSTEEKLEDGSVLLRSYGSMTYAGLKTYLFANLKKDDPRIKAAVDWIKSHYMLDGHPGFDFDQVKRTELTGIYYYYMMMARGLDAYGENPFVTANGVKHDWAKEMAEKLIGLQQAEGQKVWKNDHSRWEEGDPIVVSSYVLIAYSSILKHL